MLDIKPEINVNVDGKLSHEIYTDGAKPLVQELGKTGGLIGKTVNMLLCPLSATVWGFEKVQKVIVERLSQKLSDVPAAELQTPKANIAVPIVEAMRTVSEEESLQDMYIELLAKAMDKRTAYGVLPGFPEIIKQLSSDEAKLLKYIANAQFLPIVGLRFFQSTYGAEEDYKDPIPGEPYNSLSAYGPGTTVIEKFNVFGEKCNLSFPDLSAAYLDNLRRLGLIKIEESLEYTDSSVYKETESHPLIQHAIQQYKVLLNNNEYTFNRGLIKLSTFGNFFCRSCGLIPASEAVKPAGKNSDAHIG